MWTWGRDFEGLLNVLSSVVESPVEPEAGLDPGRLFAVARIAWTRKSRSSIQGGHLLVWLTLEGSMGESKKQEVTWIAVEKADLRYSSCANDKIGFIQLKIHFLSYLSISIILGNIKKCFACFASLIGRSIWWSFQGFKGK